MDTNISLIIINLKSGTDIHLKMVELSLNFSITEGNFMITDKAATKINELMANESRNNQALQIKITPGGCAGFSYDMGWVYDS